MSNFIKEKYALLMGASMIAAAGAMAPAGAQEAAPRASEEIVITATGRAQALQDVPIAVSAIGEEQLQNAGISDVRDLQQIAPGFTFNTGQSNAAGANAYIRGVGTGSDNVGFESAVGIFIDGVYRARPGIALSDLPQVERVEVLRGPQGTLYGKNTTAGVISVTTAGPEFDWRRYGEVSVGNYNLQQVKGGVTGPIIEDVFAVRLDGAITKRDGTIEDFVSGRGVNNRDRWNVRGQGLWDISPDATLRVIVDAAQTEEECCSAVIVKDSAAINGLLNGLANFRGLPAARPKLDPEARRTGITPGRELQEDVEEVGGSAQLDWDLGGVNFTSVTSYRDWSVQRGQDIDFSAVDRAYRAGDDVGVKNFTQEFRFQGEAGKLDWLIGGFYGKEDLSNTSRIRNGRDSTLYANALINAATSSPLGLYGTNPATLLFARDATLNPADPTLADSILVGICGTNLACFADPAQRAGANAIADTYALRIGATVPTEGSGQQSDKLDVSSESMSIFTHNIISLTDKLKLTIGARYNDEQKDLTGTLNSTSATCDALRATTPIQLPIGPGGALVTVATNASITAGIEAAAVGGNAALGTILTVACNPVVNTVANGAYSDSRSDKEWNGTVSLAYSATDDLLLFATASHGYKGGGYNLDRSALPLRPQDAAFSSSTRPNVKALEFGPEFVDSYEIGAKWTSANGVATVNVTGFTMNFSDYQFNAFNGFNFQNSSIEELTSNGVEFEAVLRPTRDLTLQGSLVYIDAKFGDDASADFRTAGEKATNTGQAKDLRGDKLATPDMTLTGALTWNRPIEGTSLATLLYIDTRWVSDAAVQNLNRDPSTDNPAYAIVNARLGIGAINKSWSIEAFGRNLTDEYYNLLAFGVPEQPGIFAGYPNEPRTYGVTLRTSF